MNELPTDTIYDLTRPMQVAVSPDGTRIAFRVLEYDRSENNQRSSVFTVPADGSRDPYRLTRVSDAASVITDVANIETPLLHWSRCWRCVM